MSLQSRVGAYYVVGDIKGGRSFKHSFNALLDHYGAEAPRVLYLGAACNNDLYHKQLFEKGLLGKNARPNAVFKSLNLKAHMAWDERDADPARITEQFEKADIVFFDGGGLEPLKATFERFDLADHVRNAFERGAYVGGMCIGGSYLGEKVVLMEGGDVSVQKGAGLVPGVAVSCHMDIPEQYDRRSFYLRQVAGQGIHHAIGLSTNQGIMMHGGVICRLPSTDRNAGIPYTIDAAGNMAGIELVCGT